MLGFRTGQVCSHECDIGDKWTHIVASRAGKETRLYINGQLAAVASAPNRKTFDLSNANPLFIGYGTQTYFKGAISDLQLYSGALDEHAIKKLSEPQRPSGLH